MRGSLILRTGARLLLVLLLVFSVFELLRGHNEPGGGFFIWLRLPDEVDAAALLVTARQQDVGFQPGVRFSSSQSLRNYARLSFAYYDLPELEEGTKRLASVLAAHLAEMPA